MSNSIGRLRTMGIAAQFTFGTAAASPVYTLPYMESPFIDALVSKIENSAALGSAYSINAVMNGNEMANVPLNIKVDEDQLPIFFTQRFAPTSVTVSGDASVYTHTLAYTNSTRHWYTLWLQDDDRKDYVVRDALFDSLNIRFDSEFMVLEGNAVGTYPTVVTVSNTVTQPKEFVGRHTTVSYGDYGSTKTALSALSANINHQFPLIDDSDKHALGSATLAANMLTEDRFEIELVGLEADRDNWEDYTNNVKKQIDFTTRDTVRTVSGTVVGTKPSIKFEYPVASVINHTEDAPKEQLIKENITLLALDQVGVSDAPLKITVVNTEDGTTY